jgi:DNA-binding NarL/FixJ family response regulator
MSRTRDDRPREPPPLSERELEVLTLLAAGLPYKQIARQLNISRSTVHSHLDHIYLKLDARSGTHAVAKALRLGLIHHPD